MGEICFQCQRKFAARETLNRHQRTHTGEKPHVCQYCGKSFIQASQLRAHIFHHTGENGFYCDVCGKAFNRKARLNIHKKFVHEGAIPFMCEICNKNFTRREDLVKHSLLHSGIKRKGLREINNRKHLILLHYIIIYILFQHSNVTNVRKPSRQNRLYRLTLILTDVSRLSHALSVTECSYGRIA